LRSFGAVLLAPLGVRTYRHLFAAQVLSLVGNCLATVAMALLTYDLAGKDAQPLFYRRLFLLQ